MQEHINGSFRRKVNFAAVSNDALKDPKLSLKAKGLYALIQSYITMPGLTLSKSLLRSKCKEKEKAFDSAWCELKDCGYLKIYRTPTGKNDWFQYEYDLLDTADDHLPSLITLNKRGEVTKQKTPSEDRNPHPPQKGGSGKDISKHEKEPVHSDGTGKRKNGNPHPLRNGGDGNSHSPRFAPYAGGTPCEAHPMPDGGDMNKTLTDKTLNYKTKSYHIPSVCQSGSRAAALTDGRTDEIRRELLRHIDFDWIAETHPQDAPAAETLLNYMVEMLSTPFTKLHGMDQSRYAIKKWLDDVDEEDIVGFLAHMRGTKVQGIRNISAYWKNSFINYLGEERLALATI